MERITLKYKALRLVYDDYTSSFSESLKHDKTISIHHRNIHCVAIEMFKAKDHLSPSFMNEMFEQNKGPSTRMGTTFVRPKVNSVYKGDNSLRIFGPIVWNKTEGLF